MWSFTYITEGGVIHNHYRGYGHSHIIYNTEGGVIQYITEGGSFTYNTEGGVIHIHYRRWGHSHTLQMVWSLQSVGHSVHCRGCGHSHTLQRVGSFTYNTEGGVIHISLLKRRSYKFCSDESGNVKIIL